MTSARSPRAVAAAALSALLAAGGCTHAAHPSAAAAPSTSASARSQASIKLTSTAFADQGVIPAAYTCDAPNGAVSPPLAWSGVPAGTSWLALYAYDNTGSVIHWIVIDLEPAVSSLPAGTTGGGVVVANYLPMCPGTGNDDQYQFTLYAEPASYRPPKIGGSYGVDPDALAAHALGVGSLTGYYSQ
jgi:phosphatidylethanolamine-binding protein (PEBP) family uncharacterized protein